MMNRKETILDSMVSSQVIVFQNGTVILPDRTIDDGVVICRNGRIREAGRKGRVSFPRNAHCVDARKGFIGPGYVDIHVHGGDGADFMDGSVEAVRTVARAHARH